MPSFLINDEERESLRGLPMLAREIYVFGLRPFMDYRTGLVGERRGISWKSIAEELYVEPHQGIKGGEPSEKELRRALTWLQKVELVGPNQAERRLIFQLLKASRDQSARNKVGSKWADEEGSYVGGLEPNNHGPYTEEEGREVGGGESSKVGTPPVTGDNHTVPSARDDFETPSTAGQWCQFFIRERRFQMHVVQTAKTMPLFAQWVERRITTSQVRTAMETADAKLGAVPDTPLYYRNFLEQLLVETQRLSLAQEQRDEHTTGQQGPSQGQAGIHPASRGFPRRQGPLSSVDRVKANNAAAEAARQAAGETLAEDGGDVRPPLDVEFWRQG